MWSWRCSSREGGSSRKSSGANDESTPTAARFAAERARRVDDVEQMEVVLEVRERRAPLAHACNRLAQAVGPEPRGLDRVMVLPVAGLVAPDLESARVPVVAEKVRGAVRAVELEGGSAIALDGLARHDAGERSLGVAEDDVRDVRIRASDLRPSRVSGGHGERVSREHLDDRTEDRSQALEVVDAGLGERARPARVVPRRPVRSCVAVEPPGRVDAPERTVAHDCPEGPQGRRELDERRRKEMEVALGRESDERFAFGAVVRERFLDDDMLAVLEREARELRVRGWRGENDDDVDIGLDDLTWVADELRAGTPSQELGPRLAIPCTDRPLPGQTAWHEPVQHLQVRGQHVPGADDPDADGRGHSVSAPRSRYRAPCTSRTGVSTPSRSRTTSSRASQPGTVQNARQRGSGPRLPIRSQSRLSVRSLSRRDAARRTWRPRPWWRRVRTRGTRRSRARPGLAPARARARSSRPCRSVRPGGTSPRGGRPRPDAKMRSHSPIRSIPASAVYQTATYSGSGPVRKVRPRLRSRTSSACSLDHPLCPRPAAKWNASIETPGRRLMYSM